MRSIISRCGKQVPGVMRLYLALRQQGLSVGFKRLRRLLRSNGIFHRYHRKYVATTDSNHNLARLPNLIDRQFNRYAINQAWSGDITYIPTDEGWLFMASVLDLASRCLVGYSFDSTMKTSLVMDALRMAIANEHPAPGHQWLYERAWAMLGQRSGRIILGNPEAGNATVIRMLQQPKGGAGYCDSLDILLQWNSAPFTAGDAIPLSIQIKGAGLVIRAFLSRFEIPRPRPSSNITGSDVRMRDLKIEETLGGRFLTENVFPLSFSEFFRVKGVENSRSELESVKGKIRIRRAFAEFFEYGGFSKGVNAVNRLEAVNDAFREIYLADVIVRHTVSNTSALRMLLKQVAESIGQPLSFTRLTKMVKEAGMPIAKNTCISYLQYACETCLVLPISNIVDKLQERESTQKYYFVDNGFI